MVEKGREEKDCLFSPFKRVKEPEEEGWARESGREEGAEADGGQGPMEEGMVTRARMKRGGANRRGFCCIGHDSMHAFELSIVIGG